MRSRMIPLIILTTFLLAAAALPAAAHGDHDHGGEPARDVKMDAYEDRLVIALEREDNASSEEVKFEFDANEGDLKLEFEREAGDAESAFEYKAELQEVVEYVDEDGDGAFDPVNDTVVQSFRVDSEMTWTMGDVQDVTVGLASGKKVTATGTFDGADAGTMTVTFYAFGEWASVDAASLRPTDIKFDIGFEDFPWAQEDTRLALDLKLEVKVGSEIEDDAEDASLNATSGDVTGYFTWVPTAVVDGADTPVVAHVYESTSEGSATEVEHEQKLTLSYAHGDSILHDPTMGLTYEALSTTDTTNGGDNGMPGPTALLVAAGSLGAALVARRRQG